MKQNVILPVVTALLLLILPLPALPLDSIPTNTPPTVNTDNTTPSDSSTDVFLIWDEKNKQTVRMSERDFIFYTVAAEMPVSYGAEALKAQTIASYTYYCYQRNRQHDKPTASLNGADFSDVPACFPEGYTDEALQEKWGEQYAIHHRTLTDAVDAVFGYTMQYDGAPILAAYHAISCGATESAQVVWEVDYPYLQSVPSAGDTLADNFETTTILTATELAAAFADTNSVSFSGTADTWLGKTSVSEAGTVTTQVIGGASLTGREVRKILNLRSSSFTAVYKNDTFVFTVHGYGHGVGMSQYGAGYLARQGMSAEEILRYYYTDITIVNT